MKSISLNPLSLLFLSAFVGFSTVQAADENNHGQLSAKDYKFVSAATCGGKMEVSLGELAAQNGIDPSVRDFGTQMVKDHGAANLELTQLTTQKGATVADASEKEQKMTKHLQGLKGSDFDRAYIKQMVSDHKTTIKEFQKEADSGDDADIKGFAAKTLPTLQEHLQMAEDTQARLSTTASIK